MLYGESEHAQDDKGRVIIPQKHREALGDGFFITKGLDRCLWLIPQRSWDRIDTQLKKLDVSDENARKLERLLYPGTVGRLDKQGRLNIPANLRRHAGIQDGGPVVLVGVRNRLELWHADRWYAEVDDLTENCARYAQPLKGAF